jgi:hypothetical protein
MPITYPDAVDGPAVFAQRCEAEEADALLDWLRRTPEPQADLGACTDLHTALAQLLLAAAARIAVPPPDGLLAACLAGAGAAMTPMPAQVPSPAVASPPETAPSRARRRGKTRQVQT